MRLAPSLCSSGHPLLPRAPLLPAALPILATWSPARTGSGSGFWSLCCWLQEVASPCSSYKEVLPDGDVVFPSDPRLALCSPEQELNLLQENESLKRAFHTYIQRSRDSSRNSHWENIENVWVIKIQLRQKTH